MRATFLLLLAVFVGAAVPCAPSAAQAAPAIEAISVCGAGKGAGSCPAGTSDTQQLVLAGGGRSINRAGFIGMSDEHQSIFAPGTLGSNRDYLFFVASNSKNHPGTGLVVLAGGTGPSSSGKWTLSRAPGYGDYGGSVGQELMAPAGNGVCPTNADQTFDLDYAAPGSIVPDPRHSGALLMVYEGTNTCAGAAPATSQEEPCNTIGYRYVQSDDSYITLGIATSNDEGKTWPTYAPTSSFPFVALPCNSGGQGPAATLGAFGSGVCEGNLLSGGGCAYAKPYSDYGRYAVLSPPCTLADLFAAKQGVGGLMGDSEPSAFLDDVHPGAPPTLYVVHTLNPGSPQLLRSVPACASTPQLPDGRHFDLALAAASLAVGESGSGPGSGALLFSNWNGSTIAPLSSEVFDGTLDTSPQAPLLPDDTSADGSGTAAYQSCEDPFNEQRSDGSISWYAATNQYVLLFVCHASEGDPNPVAGQAPSSSAGAAWFYSTTASLADGPWATPKEVIGSWDTQSGGYYNGWYPTMMSLGEPPSQLTTTGYTFYLWGCESGTCDKGRRYSERAFTIDTTGGPYSYAPKTTVTAQAAVAPSASATATVRVTFSSNEPNSGYTCSVAGRPPQSCVSPLTASLPVGRTTFTVRATNPFGIAGPWTPTSLLVVAKPSPPHLPPPCANHCV